MGAATDTIIYGDDPCMGVHLREIVTGKHAPPARIEIDDRDSYSKFAMEVECNVSWGRVRDISWAVHHASPEQLHCMWNADIEHGYIRFIDKEAPEDNRGRSMRSGVSRLSRFPKEWNLGQSLRICVRVRKHMPVCSAVDC